MDKELRIEIYKTDQINDKIWEKLTSEFNSTFNRHSTSKEKKAFYSSNPFGFSYHAIALDIDDTLAGHTSLIPVQYNLRGKKAIMGISGGTFVTSPYRNYIYLFKKMYNQLKEFAAKEGVVGTLGVPNKNSFQYSMKILKKVYLGDLNYYILPIRIGNIIDCPGKELVNFFSGLFCTVTTQLLSFYSLLHNPKERKAVYKLEMTEEFLNHRFGDDYHKISEYDYEIFYKVECEEGVRVAYLMLATEKSRATLRAFLKSIKTILRQENVDLILYIGLLNFYPNGLIKVPVRKTPKKLPLTLDIIDKEIDTEPIRNIKNWNFSLIDFDVR